jgi:hypothetical protein
LVTKSDVKDAAIYFVEKKRKAAFLETSVLGKV